MQHNKSFQLTKLFPASESYREMKNLPIMDSVG